MNFARMCARLDPKCYKAFLAVVSEGSFSAAAHKAAMTISGVSQHIANIEEVVGSPIFLRTPTGCKLTEKGSKFFLFVKSYSNLVADFFEDLAGEEESLQGIVRYAMPQSCAGSEHFVQLLKRRLAHPLLELNVQLISNESIFEQLVDGKIDFGFVTETIENPLIKYQPFCQEEYVLVASNQVQLDALANGRVIDQPFIAFPGFDVYVNCFLRHFYPELHNIDYRFLHRITGRISTLDGAIRMVEGGLGISIFPKHCVQTSIDRGGLICFEKIGYPPLMSEINIAHHSRNIMSRRVEAVIQWFMDMH
ncbi:MAG: LysR family transcriptional regulator [Undibacterium sp.]|nr:LysR family transcriptional regulator [Undibacterium sp.]